MIDDTTKKAIILTIKQTFNELYSHKDDLGISDEASDKLTEKYNKSMERLISIFVDDETIDHYYGDDIFDS